MSISEKHLKKSHPHLSDVEDPTPANGYGWRGNGYGWQLESLTARRSSTTRSSKGTLESDIPIYNVNPSTTQLNQSTSNLLSKSEPQNFYKLRDENLRNGTLFEDPEFPATATSLNYSPKGNDEELDFNKFVWLRPKEIVKTPELFVHGYTRFDVIQGRLGNCWVITALANLAMDPRLFLKIVPDDNRGFEQRYAGIYHFKFWQHGKWVDVVIDDRLPTHNGKLLYVHSNEEREFWGALLEKAYAKLHGSYEALQGGSVHETMQDFTGGVTESYKMEELQMLPQHIFKMLLGAFERGSLMSASITDPSSDDDRKSISSSRSSKMFTAGNYAYIISSLKYVLPLNVTKKIPLLRLRQPTGDETEWASLWTNKPLEWRNVSEDVKRELGLTFDSAGELWMTYNDFQTYFTELEICNLPPESLKKEETNKGFKKKWAVAVREGFWVRGATAGGNKVESFWQNPQYRINLTSPDEDDKDSKCTLIVSLVQKHRRSTKPIELFYVSFSIFHLPDPDHTSKPLKKAFFSSNSVCGRPPYIINSRDVSCRFRFPRGTYCIIPWTTEANKEGSFMLRVFSEKDIHMELYDEKVAVQELDSMITKRIFATKEEPIDKRIQQMFLKLAGIHLEVNWQELKEILDFSLKGETNNKGFSEDVCRSIVALADKDRSGKLDIQEFKRLWIDINHWKAAFKLHDKDNLGTFNGFELREALNSAGYRVNNRILVDLVHRYGNNGYELDFEAFILCALKMRAMTELFKSKDDDKSNTAKYNLAEWMQDTLYC